MSLSILDYFIVAAYLIAIASIGIYISTRGSKSTNQYFVAEKQIPHWAIGFTLMATLISSNTLVAHPAIVYQKSMILVPGFLILPIVLVLVAIFIVPFYRRVVGMSAYEYIGKRFGIGGRYYTSFGFVLDRTFDVGVTLVTTAIVINVMTGIDIRYVIVGITAFTLIYTVIGGITAVVWTDVVQGVILIGGGVIIIAILLFSPKAGEPFSVVGAAWDAGKFSLGDPELSFSSLFDQENRTIWMFMAAMVIVWSRKYVCDQNMVQKYLIAKTDQEARKGTMLGACLSVPILVGFNFIGACLFGFYELANVAPPEVKDQILPHFILNFLPQGIIGLIIAAILAASTSSVSADLTSISAVINRDYFQRLFPDWPDIKRLLVGRLTVFTAGVLSTIVAILLAPTEDSQPLAEKALTIATIISAGTLGLFFLGFLTKRATRQGCYIGIVACVLFTAWALVTSGKDPVIDLGAFNYSMNTILIGIFGQFVMFGVGYISSLIVGGYRPDDIDHLTFGSHKLDLGTN